MDLFVAFVVVLLGVVILVAGVRGTYANVFKSITGTPKGAKNPAGAATDGPVAGAILASSGSAG